MKPCAVGPPGAPGFWGSRRAWWAVGQWHTQARLGPARRFRAYFPSQNTLEKERCHTSNYVLPNQLSFYGRNTTSLLCSWNSHGGAPVEGGLRVTVRPTARPLALQHALRSPPSGLGIAPMPLRTIYFYGSRIIPFPSAGFMGQKYLPSGIRDTETVALAASAPHVGCRRLHGPQRHGRTVVPADSAARCHSPPVHTL